MPRTTEPAFNVKLAEVLDGKYPGDGSILGAEQTKVFLASGKRPDIVVRPPNNLTVIVETEFEPARSVEEDARKRIGQVFATGEQVEQVVAVQIPSALRKIQQRDIVASIERADFRYCVFSGEASAPDRWPAEGWVTGSVNDLATCIELVALSERRIARGTNVLQSDVRQIANLLRSSISPTGSDTLANIAKLLKQEDSDQTSRMAIAILANAFCFHQSIAGSHKIPQLAQLMDAPDDGLSDLIACWNRILKEVNYWPIFSIAKDILIQIPARTARKIIRRMVRLSAALVDIGTTSLQDLSGRLFQRLIADRRFLATFYTLPSSSALLAELAVARLDRDWSDPTSLINLRVADLACGTGTLIGAAYRALRVRYRRAGGDDSELHSVMMENSLIAADIMPAATHLTAAMLSSAHPTLTFRNTQIVTMPYGEQPEESGRELSIGSLDLIQDETVQSLFGTGRTEIRGQRRGRDDDERGRMQLQHGVLDLVIMNPPFTRPTNHEATEVPVPSFAGFRTSEEEQKAMSRRLAQIRREQPMPAGNGNAGLASNFIDLAHAKVAPGGVLALVLPATFLQGQSWSGARGLLREEYRDFMFITITAAGNTMRAFSADTGIAEVLVIATRKNVGDEDSDQACFVNLDQKPATLLEAVEIAQAIRRLDPEQERGLLSVADQSRAGNFLRAPFQQTGCAGLREYMLVQTAMDMQSSKLKLPQRRQAIPLPLTRLGEIGTRGLLHRDINGTERNANGQPRGPLDIWPRVRNERATFPVLWKHAASRETMLIVEPEAKGIPRAGCEERAGALWRRSATRLHFNQDFRLNSQPLAACYTREPSIGGSAWPNFRAARKSWEKPLVLWANTTLGLISFWWMGTRQQLGRARITVSMLPDLTVLDPRTLSRSQITKAGQLFKQFQSQELLPANEAYRDEIRKALDRAVLVDLLGLPRTLTNDLDLLREQWCSEPSVHGGQNTRPGGTEQ